VPLKYPCIICSSFKHHALACLRKVEVQNMLWTKPTTIVNVVAKILKHDNVLINVVVDVMTRNQVPKQQVLKGREPVKAKTTTNWQIKG
jgi:hypothetical protein